MPETLPDEEWAEGGDPIECPQCRNPTYEYDKEFNAMVCDWCGRWDDL